MRRISWLSLLMFIPAIVLSALLWNEYVGSVKQAANEPLEVNAIFYFDEGTKLLALQKSEEGFRSLTFDVSKQLLEKEDVILSDIHREWLVTYHQDNLIVATHDREQGMQIVRVTPNKQQIISSNDWFLNSFLSSDVYRWRGQFLILSAVGQSAMVYGQLKDGKLSKTDLKDPAYFSSRPIRMRNISNSYHNMMPMFEFNLKDGTYAYMSGLLDNQQSPVIYHVSSDIEHRFQSELEAMRTFTDMLQEGRSQVVRVSREYPSEPYLYDVFNKEWGSVLSTPQSLYQAKVFPLNEDEVLVVGSDQKDELLGKINGYVYNERTARLTEVTPLLAQIAYEDLTESKIQFSKEKDRALLYFTQKNANTAGWMNIDSSAFEVLHVSELSAWKLTDKPLTPSIQGLLDYIKQGGSLVENWISWVILGSLLALLPVFIINIIRRKRQNHLNRGVVLDATIIDLNETNTRVNDQPVIRYKVQFHYENVVRELEIEKITSYLNMPDIGMQVTISYDPRNNKAIFLTVDEAEQMEKTKEVPRVIKDAELRKISSYGMALRGKVLLLSFEASGCNYDILVVQAPGFCYQEGDQAELIQIDGHIYIYWYGSPIYGYEKQADSYHSEITRIDTLPIVVNGKQLLSVESILTLESARIHKVSSHFVPQGVKIAIGQLIPIQIRQTELTKEIRLANCKQGGARVVEVHMEGTVGDRPWAMIKVEIHGEIYTIQQSIDPAYGVQVDDLIWVAYDPAFKDAMIIRYAG